MKIKIEKITSNSANKQGQAYLDKNSRPYYRMGIYTQYNGQGKWLSGFAYANDPQMKWKVGDEVDVEIEEKGQYLNFKVPKKQAGISADVMEKLFAKLDRIEKKLDMLTVGDEPEVTPDEIGEPTF